MYLKDVSFTSTIYKKEQKKKKKKALLYQISLAIKIHEVVEYILGLAG